jgi:acid phosphatase type 7
LSSRRQFLKTALATALVAARGNAAGATVLRYPYLQNLRRNRVTIRWTTAEPGFASVSYMREGGTPRTMSAVTEEFTSQITGSLQTYYRHQAVLTGLQAGTDYKYRVLMDDEPVLGDDELAFRTTGVNEFQFLAFGDSGTGSAEQVRLGQKMSRENPRFVLHTGDLCYPDSTFENLERKYFDHYRGMMKQTPFFPCPGNHDYYNTEAVPYITVHDVPVEEIRESDHGRYFSFDWNNAHFVSLDTNTPLVRAANRTGDMLNWFRSDLETTKKFWTVVYFHHPPYAFGPNEKDSLSKAARDLIVPIIDAFGVPLVLNGHEHSYQRSHPIRRGRIDDNGTVYVTTGGGGASLYPVHANPLLGAGASIHHYLRASVDGYSMTLESVSINGNEIDRVTLTPKPILSAEAVLDSASFLPAVAAGGLISIFGKFLSAIDATAARIPLPRELSKLNVTVNGQPIPLLMATAQQVNAQLPFDIVGSATVRVTTPNGSVDTTIQVREFAPSVFEGKVFHDDGTPVSEEAPASPGELVMLYATGLGPLREDVPAGTAPETPVPTAAHVEVLVSGEDAAVIFAGLAPGLVGPYKVMFRVPEAAAAGQHTAFVSVAGFRSNVTTLLVG